MADADFFDVVRSQRGIRRYAPDEVPDDVVRQIIEAATWLPAGAIASRGISS
jgi:nitroreductase